MARKKKEECKGAPAWLTSFSDLMSLLLTFFILLYSMSSLDISKAMKFLSYFQGEKAKSFKHISVVKPVRAYTEDVALKIKKRIKKILPVSAYQIVVTKEYVMIRLFNEIIFKKGSFELTPKSKKALKNIAELLKQLKGNFKIKVVGHTSSEVPLGKIPGVTDYWDLSIRRATSVVRFLIKCGVEPSRLSAVGYGNSRPLYTWKNPILQARNRRVEIFLEVNRQKEETLEIGNRTGGSP